MKNRISIEDLATELGLSFDEILTLCISLGISLGDLDDEMEIVTPQADRVRRKVERQRAASDLTALGPSESPNSEADPDNSSRSQQSLRVLHLQALPTVGAGRDALRSRSLLSQFISDGHEVVVRHVVGNRDDFEWIASNFPDDFMTVDEFRESLPDVILSESSLFLPGLEQLRVPIDLLEEYLRSGGVVVSDELFEPQFHSDNGWKAIQRLCSIKPADGHSVSNTRTRVSPTWLQVSDIEYIKQTSANWLSPAFDGIERLRLSGVRPLVPSFLGVNLFISESDSSLALYQDLRSPIRPPFCWGGVHAVGKGYLALISGGFFADAIVDDSPDNALWIEHLVELLVGEIRRDRALRERHPGPATKQSAEALEFLMLIAGGESPELEFKSTARFDTRTKERNAALEDEIARQVSAFMNAAGGTLLVGVADDGQVTGIAPDFEFIKQRNSDGWIRFIGELLDDRLGATASTRCRIRTLAINDKEIGIIQIDAGSSPTWFTQKSKDGSKSQRFYVRGSNRRTELTPSETHEYIQEHWR